MRLTNIQKKTTPFHKDESIEFYKGQIATDTVDEVFQYSISSKLFLGAYRLTLSFDDMEKKTICVFQIRHQDEDFLIQTENTQAKEIWDSQIHSHHKHMHDAVSLILDQHLR